MASPGPGRRRLPAPRRAVSGSPDRGMLSPAGSFHVYGDRGALVLQSLCIELVGAGADRHEEELGLAFLLEFDLVKRVGLDLQAAGLDLAQPDVVEEVRRDDGVFLDRKSTRLNSSH